MEVYISIPKGLFIVRVLLSVSNDGSVSCLTGAFGGVRTPLSKRHTRDGAPRRHYTRLLYMQFVLLMSQS